MLFPANNKPPSNSIDFSHGVGLWDGFLRFRNRHIDKKNLQEHPAVCQAYDGRGRVENHFRIVDDGIFPRRA